MSEANKALEAMQLEIVNIRKALADAKASESYVNKDAMEAAINKRLEEYRKATPAPKGGFVADDEDKPVDETSVLFQKSGDSKVIEFQKWNDNCVLMGQLLNRPVNTLKYFQKSRDVSRGLTDLAKAMAAGSAAAGAEWIPTNFSQDLYYQVHLATKMAALFPQISMPSNPYKLPVVAGDMTPFIQSENTTDVNTSTGTQFTASTAASTNVVFTATKIAIRTLFSEELTEDAVFPVLDFIKNNLALTMAFGLENALLNGDTTATHQDADVTNASDVRKAWKGLRKLTQSANDVSLATFNASQLRAMRAKMTRYGVDPSKLAWTCSAKALMQFLGLAEVITMEKYGSEATIVRGELARLDNIPIVVSEKMRDDLNASGVNDSTTNTKGIVLLTYVPAFLLGLRRGITVRARFDEERDQSIMVSTWRGDFEPLYPVASNPTVVKGVNMTV